MFVRDSSKILLSTPSPVKTPWNTFSVDFSETGFGVFHGEWEIFVCLGLVGGNWLPPTMNYTSCSRKLCSNTFLLHWYQNSRLLFMTFHFLLFSLFFRNLIKTTLCWLLSPALIFCAIFPLLILAPGNWLIKPLVHEVIRNTNCLVHSVLYCQTYVGLCCAQIDNFNQKLLH